jgi:5-formyltetrahydrofolate cyclo-ligase
MTSTKSERRRALLAVRAAIPAEIRRTLSGAIAERTHSLACFRDARTVLGYVAMGAEVDPAALLATMAAPVFFPARVSGDAPRWLAQLDGASEGRVEVAHAALADPIVAVVPGVGYDLRGVRLGRGRGFYDRALRELRRTGDVTVVALAFECQVVGDLPFDVWDESVDWIVTERRVIDTSTDRSRREATGR